MELKEEQQHALYQVSLKILLGDGDKVLITTGNKGDFDLPGGRIDSTETKAPFQSIIAREVQEELGEDVTFQLGEALFATRSFNKEGGPGVFNIVFDAVYLSGEIKLSPEHTSFEWVDKRTYRPARGFFAEQDEEKYQSFKKYFESLADS